MKIKIVENKLKEVLGDEYVIIKNIYGISINKKIGAGLRTIEYFNTLTEAYSWIVYNAVK